MNQISRSEFEDLLGGLDDESANARYEIYLQEQFELEVEKHLANNSDLGKKSNGKVTSKNLVAGKIKKSLNHKFPLAAVFVLLIGVLFSIAFIISQSESNDRVGSLSKAIATHQSISKATPKGRMFRMNLEDGSFVHLNAVSSITYPEHFESSERNVEVKGEAFFNIKRDEQRPFLIDVKDYQVEVLGTSFDVQAYEDENDFSVTVASGSVRVNLDKSGDNTVVLEKNQKLTYNPKTNLTEITEVDVESELSWRQGILHFDSTPMTKVELMLERWYGIDLVIADADIYKKTLTGTHHNENIKSVIEALTYATGTNYKIKGNSIIIKY